MGKYLDWLRRVNREKKAARSLVLIAERSTEVLARVGAWLLLGLVLVMTGDVVARYVFNSPFFWAHDFIEYFTAASVFLIIAYCLKVDRHVKVEFIRSFLSERQRSILEVATCVVALGLFTVITWKSGEAVWISYQLHESSGTTLDAPLWPTKLLVPIGTFLLCMQLLLKLLRTIDTVSGEG